MTGCDSEDSGMGDPPPEPDPVTITINNIGASAWEVTNVDGASIGDISDGTSENPALTLTVGTRYRFENNGGVNNHPLGFQDANADYLLRQESGETGSLEGDSGINYVEDDDGVTFTYTQALADDVATYICTFHSSMVGDIQTN